MPLLVHSARFPGSSRARPWLLALASSPLLFLFVTRLSFSTSFLLALLSSLPLSRRPLFTRLVPLHLGRASSFALEFAHSTCAGPCRLCWLARHTRSLRFSIPSFPALASYRCWESKRDRFNSGVAPHQRTAIDHTPSATSRLAFFSNFPSMRYRANCRPAASPL